MAFGGIGCPRLASGSFAIAGIGGINGGGMTGMTCSAGMTGRGGASKLTIDVLTRGGDSSLATGAARGRDANGRWYGLTTIGAIEDFGGAPSVAPEVSSPIAKLPSCPDFSLNFTSFSLILY